ncbi:hypothetical protein RchiOBHm_Chr6g0286821 [Rosa chinensis]|uniref:Uncharacterized protein n=1 Tax=Rosa chinensis TaxID=74649 RepID=A0A2P6PUW8_ROSCH|nr:hypothetical protein RchiOBHm_Chr6g0286821 [Rosa chinensis]
MDYDALGLWCTMMAYTAYGTRLFSCGTSEEGESHLVGPSNRYIMGLENSLWLLICF